MSSFQRHIEGFVKRSRLSSIALFFVLSGSLVGCGQALENALAPDPKVENWDGKSSPTDSEQTSPSAEKTPSLTAKPEDELIQSTPQGFGDIADAPANLQSYIEDLARLEVLNPLGEDAEGNPLFSPNKPIKRGTFVRWIMQTNNRLNRDRPTRQFRLASPDASSAVYEDVPTSDPNFAYIQGLAESGYLPSSLTGDTNEKSFNPDGNLTRETLLQWKVPIDQPKALPTVTVEKVKETWGFKDSDKVTPKNASAIVADHANGDLSNIRRLVGASLLLQPQKPVTRAEAAAVLWYIGIEGKGYSAKDVLRSDVQAAAAEQQEAEAKQAEEEASSDLVDSPQTAESPEPTLGN